MSDYINNVTQSQLSNMEEEEAFMANLLKILAVFIFIFFSCGCAKLLPSSKVIVDSPWKNYDDAKLAYEKIIPGSTTFDDLKKLNFDPYVVPNIELINAAQVINLFMPNQSIKFDDLEPGIQQCILNKHKCTAYKIETSVKNAKRIGNFWLDILTFKRDTINTGWEFHGLITIVDNVVTYKDPAGGKPLIKMEEIVKKPLGPLQEAASFIVSQATALLP